MGAVHGVVLKYVALTAVSGAGLRFCGEASWLRVPLSVVAATNVLVCALFLLDRGTGLLGKSAKSGRAPLAYSAAWIGFVAPTWFYTKVHTLLGRALHGIPEATEVLDGWWLGGRYADVAPGRPDRWSGVLDLTCELPERCIRDTDEYKLVPLWDGAPPHPDRIEEAADFCVAARRRGPVLVHCAHGRGRSTTVLCACLVKAGLFPDWEAAFLACKRKRPCVGLNKRMRAKLAAWQAMHDAGRRTPDAIHR